MDVCAYVHVCLLGEAGNFRKIKGRELGLE